MKLIVQDDRKSRVTDRVVSIMKKKRRGRLFIKFIVLNLTVESTLGDLKLLSSLTTTTLVTLERLADKLLLVVGDRERLFLDDRGVSSVVGNSLDRFSVDHLATDTHLLKVLRVGMLIVVDRIGGNRSRLMVSDDVMGVMRVRVETFENLNIVGTDRAAVAQHT